MTATELIGEPKLKDGRKIGLRLYNPADKEGLVSFYAGLSSEVLKWALPPYDRQRIERWVSDLENTIELLALWNGKIVGHLHIGTAPLPRLRGIGQLLIYLRDDFHNSGLGTAMMREAIAISRSRGLHRIGLSVVADNTRAIALYEKVGFRHEGQRRECYLGEDGRYHDEVDMGLLL